MTTARFATADPALAPAPGTAKADRPLDAPIGAVLDALGRMRFGVIQLTVHDGRLVQVDVTERKRFA